MWNAVVKISAVYETAVIAEIASLADEIWHEYYRGLFSKGQIDYMLDLLQSERAISKAIANDQYTYYAIWDEDLLVGYCGVQPSDKYKVLFLSNIYLRADYRGRKIGRLVFAMLTERCVSEGYASILLAVNKGNERSIKIFQKLGFVMEREALTEIGNGYALNNYIMRCPVRTAE